MDIFRIYSDEEKSFIKELSTISLVEDIDPFSLEQTDMIESYVIHDPTEEYQFLHEPAIISFKGVLYTAWYNCPRTEQIGRSPIRGRRSYDYGKTWTSVEIIADDETEKLFYCPPVYGICDDHLYMLINEMVGPDLMHALDLFILNEETDRFELLWTKPIPFKLNTNVYSLKNGKLILPGRIAEPDGFPNTPAVLISDTGKIDTDWRLVKIAEDGSLPDGNSYLHPEVSLIADGMRIYAFVRNDVNLVPLLYVSDDYGEHWSSLMTHNLILSNSKIYSGTLSNGRNYIIGNVPPGRGNLAIYFSEPNTMSFTVGYLLQAKKPWKNYSGRQWSYPVAWEENGKLYIIYSADETDPSIRGSLLSICPINIQ